MDGQPNPAREALDDAMICGWMTEAGRMALDAYRRQQDIRLKADGTPTTAIDHQVEAYLLERIRAYDPLAQILSEESGLHGQGGKFFWAIDPLDGTRAFAAGLPVWGVSVGILLQERPVAGGLCLPVVDELYWGDGNGAFVNGRPLSPCAPASLDDPLASLLVPSNSHLVYDIDFHRLRSLGSTAAHLVYVARGAAVGALTRRVKLWDVAGALPLLQQRGIQLRYLSGAPFDVRDLLHGETAPEPLVAAQAAIVEALMKRIRPKPNPCSVICGEQ